jgi:hypothetical protein
MDFGQVHVSQQQSGRDPIRGGGGRVVGTCQMAHIQHSPLQMSHTVHIKGAEIF